MEYAGLKPDKRDNIKVFKVNTKENRQIEYFCKERGVTVSSLVRYALKEIKVIR